MNGKAELTGSHSPVFSLTEVTELLGPFSVCSIYGALFWSGWKLLSPLHDRSIFSSSKSPFRSIRGVPRNLHEQVTYKQSGTSVPNKELHAQEQVGKALPFLLSWLRLAGSVKDTFPKCSALQLEAEVVRFLWGQGWPGLHSKLQTSQHFIVRPYLKLTKSSSPICWYRREKKKISTEHPNLSANTFLNGLFTYHGSCHITYPNLWSSAYKLSSCFVRSMSHLWTFHS